MAEKKLSDRETQIVTAIHQLWQEGNMRPSEGDIAQAVGGGLNPSSVRTILDRAENKIGEFTEKGKRGYRDLLAAQSDGQDTKK